MCAVQDLILPSVMTASREEIEVGLHGILQLTWRQCIMHRIACVHPTWAITDSVTARTPHHPCAGQVALRLDLQTSLTDEIREALRAGTGVPEWVVMVDVRNITIKRSQSISEQHWNAGHPDPWASGSVVACNLQVIRLQRHCMHAIFGPKTLDPVTDQIQPPSPSTLLS